MDTKRTRVAKVDHRVKLIEAVLERGARQQDALPCLEGRERRARLGGVVLEPVCLIADEQVHLVVSVPFVITRNVSQSVSFNSEITTSKETKHFDLLRK